MSQNSEQTNEKIVEETVQYFFADLRQEQYLHTLLEEIESMLNLASHNSEEELA